MIDHWKKYESKYNRTEGEKLLWYIIDSVFRECPEEYISMISRVKDGSGFSPFQEFIGIGAWFDNDWPSNYPWVVVYQGDFSEKITVSRYVQCIKDSVGVYLHFSESDRNLLLSILAEIEKWESNALRSN